MSVPEILLYYRTRNLLTQKEMADMLGVSQVGYHKWESNMSKIDMEHYCDIATLCEVNLIDILPIEWQEKLKSELG